MKIAIGGMVASGKSTLVKSLANELKLEYLAEYSENDLVFKQLLTWFYDGLKDAEMLLQIYFLNKHYMSQLEMKGSYICDRDLIEHWLFAQTNLEQKPTILAFYNSIFHQYMSQIKKPDLYIILDVNIETFKERCLKRARETEIKQFEKNLPYFEKLITTYTERLKAQCVVYGIKHIIIDANNKTADEVLQEALKCMPVIWGCNGERNFNFEEVLKKSRELLEDLCK